MRYMIECEKGKGFFPSAGATTILDELSKPALVGWGAKMAALYVRQKARPYVDIESTQGTEYLVSAKDIDDAASHYNEARDEARDDGTVVHDLIEEYITRKIDRTGSPDVKVSEKAQNAFIAFLTFEKESGIEWIESESIIYYEDDKILYAGKLDIVAKLDGKIYLLDIKTGADFSPESWLQVAAYKKAREFVGGKDLAIRFSEDDDGEYIEKAYKYAPMKIDGIGIIRLDKSTGVPEFRAICDEYETRFDKRKAQYVKKPIRGSAVIERYTETFSTLARFYYLYKDRQGLYTTKTGNIGNKIADGIRTKYAKGAE